MLQLFVSLKLNSNMFIYFFKYLVAIQCNHQIHIVVPRLFMLNVDKICISILQTVIEKTSILFVVVSIIQILLSCSSTLTYQLTKVLHTQYESFREQERHHQVEISVISDFVNTRFHCMQRILLCCKLEATVTRPTSFFFFFGHNIFIWYIGTMVH